MSCPANTSANNTSGNSRGLHQRELGNTSQAKVLLEQAEAKARGAIEKIKEAEDLERMVR